MLAHFEIWIADCHLAHVEQKGDYQCQAAIWADSHDTAMQRLARHLTPQGYRILWVDECQPARHYSRDGAEVVTGADEDQPVVLGPVLSRTGPQTFRSYLAIEEIEGFEPLDGQFGVWPLKTVPDTMKEPLFGQPDPTEQEITHYGGTDKVPPMRTYAILDAAKIFGLVEMLEMSELEYRCLFKGEAARDYRDVAPYLVELDIDNPFTTILFTYLPDRPENMASAHMWHREPGIYVRSRAGFDEIWQHFRKFTRLRDEAGKWLFFRYWQPEICRHYLSGVAHRRERIAHIMTTARNATVRIVLCDSFKNACVLTPVSPGMRPASPVVLDQIDLEVINGIALKTFSAELARWLVIAYPDRLQAYSKKQLRALSDHVVIQGQKFGLSHKEDYVYLAHIMTTLGGWFHLSGQPQELIAILQDDQPQKRARLEQAFSSAYQNTVLAPLMGEWEAVRKFVQAIPADEQIIPQHFKQFTSRFLPDHNTSLKSLVNAPSEFRDNKKLSQPQKGRYILLELCLGHRFESDPLRSWAHLPPEEALDHAWRSVF